MSDPDGQNGPILRIRDLDKSFGPLKVLDGVTLDIEQGKTTVVIGPSGCGKTVLLKHMIALLRPDRGEVLFRDQPISKMRERKLSAIRRKFGFVFQGGALFDSMTIEQNLRFPMEEHNVGDSREQVERCRHVLSLVGLDGLQNRYPEELSGGQRKRIAVARAIVLHPEIILYDEPTTGLDPIRADLINELILRLQDSLGATAVVVTHDMASARKVGDRIVMLHEGRMVVDTTPAELDRVDNEIVNRFVEGRAGEEEVAQLETGSFLGRPKTSD